MKALACSMKNEGPAILDWLAHHRALGFDEIIIGSNDCTDGSDVLLAALDAAGIITHVSNESGPDEPPQHAFYKRLRRLDLFAQVHWLAILDADEYLNIHLGNGGLDALTAAAEGADIIRVNWANFGNDGQLHFDPRPATERFTHRLPAGHRATGNAKCITRAPQRFANFHNHNPVRYRGSAPLVIATGSGERMVLPPDARLVDELRYRRPFGGELGQAQINHYAIKSWDEFALRIRRGRGAVARSAEAPPRHDRAYFDERARAAEPDHTIARYAAQTRAEVQRLMALPGIAAAQAHCLAALPGLIAGAHAALAESLGPPPA